jgi:cytoskeletal protein CcmA (bactofilin family)
MADATTIISRSSRVRGRFTGSGDLEILGHVEGEIELAGDVTVDTQGLVAANVSAQRIVVRGAVKGDLTASDAILLEEGAKVVGDVRAPRIAIAPGALLRGYVQTANAGAAPARARTQQARVEAPARAPQVAVAKAPAVQVRQAPVAAPSRPHVAVAAPPKPAAKAGPPAPVVPVLKKGAKGALNKKRAG